MNAAKILAYYSRPEIQQALLTAAKDREVVGVFRSGSFGKRPNTLVYPQDIVSQVRQGVLEFHCSLERWENPMTLHQRKGFDLILDLDCKLFEHGKIAARVLVQALEKYGIKSLSVKFTGNRGFHLGIPWGSIPKEINFQPTASLFPEVARTAGLYLREYVRGPLERELLKAYSSETLAEQTGKPLGKILTKDGIDPFQVVEIDPVLISPRHLFRMPYSLNKKTFLASVPLEKEELKTFEREDAQPEKVKRIIPFLENGKEGEADLLFTEALDWHAKKAVKERPRKKMEFTRKIPETMFPPCIKNIQGGLADGKKRSVFILIKFLHSVNWGWEEMEHFLKEWNKKNSPPLPERYITTQVRYYRDKKKFPPPNCTQEGWYVSFGVCQPDRVCVTRENIKNPVNYPFRLMRRGRFKP